MSDVNVDGDLIVRMDERNHQHFQAWLTAQYGHEDVCDADSLERRYDCQAAILGLLIDNPDLLGTRSWSEMRAMAGVP